MENPHFNPRTYHHKYYGKTIGEFTELESELFMIDVSMSLIFDLGSAFNVPKEMVLSQTAEIGETRLEIVRELLNISDVDIEVKPKNEIFESIENSKYGFRKFREDKERNMEENKKDFDDFMNRVHLQELTSNVSLN